jgi:hypothetical protein
MLDYSHVAPAVLAAAEREASRIFAQAGVRLVWTECATVPSANVPAACQGEPPADEICVRLLPRRLTPTFQNDVFGFAIAPTFASVYSEPAQLLVQTTTDSHSNLPVILGCLIAHEIGHLLLGPDQHTASGIMRGSWDLNQVQRALRGGLGFSVQEGERMRQNAAIRVNASLVAAK